MAWIRSDTELAAQILSPEGLALIAQILNGDGTTIPIGTGGSGPGVLTGTEAPSSSVGSNGDLYLDTLTYNLYGPKANGNWPLTYTSLIGPAGTAGTPGPGIRRATSDPPAQNLGANDDYALSPTFVLYGPKAGGAWPSTGTQLVGPRGPTGTQGIPGNQGTPGTAGSPGAPGPGIRTATSDPPASGVGSDGDYAISSTFVLYGPKASGAWPSTGKSLVGPTGTDGTPGTAGSPGAAGKSVLNGVSFPANTVGNNGDFYIATGSQTIYGPKSNGSWPGTGTSLIGPSGSPGTNGYSVRSGSGDPSGAIGAVGDLYIDTVAGRLYPAKTVSGWDTANRISLVGAAGNQGAQGPPGAASTVAGPPGDPGPAGASVLTGNGAPNNTLGNNGDLYIDLTAGNLYGAKTSGAWPTTFKSLLGPAGSPGPASTTPGPIGPQGAPGAAGSSAIVLGSQALSTGPMVQINGVLSTNPISGVVVGSSTPQVFVPQAPSALLGVQHNNTGSGSTIQLYDQTAGRVVWQSSQTAGGANINYGQFGNTDYPLVQGNQHVWRAISSAGGSGFMFLMPSYLTPSAQPTSVVTFPGPCGRYTATTFTATAAPCYYPGSSTTWQAAFLRTGWVYGATALFIPSGGTVATATFGLILQNLTTATNLFGVTVTANSQAQTFGPFASNQYPIVAGNRYGWFVVNAGTGTVNIDTAIVQ